MANYVISTIMLVGDKDYLDTIRQAIEICTKRYTTLIAYEEYAWASDVLEYLHINTKKYYSDLRIERCWTIWRNPRWDKKGKNLLIEEESKWERTKCLDIIVSESGGLLHNYSLVESGVY